MAGGHAVLPRHLRVGAAVGTVPRNSRGSIRERGTSHLGGAGLDAADWRRVHGINGYSAVDVRRVRNRRSRLPPDDGAGAPIGAGAPGAPVVTAPDAHGGAGPDHDSRPAGPGLT